MAVVPIRLAAASGDPGMKGRFSVGGLLTPGLGFLGLLAVFMAGARTADPLSIGVLFRHVSDPVDSLGSSCFERCCPDDPAP
jgi:hypothetical protein